MLMATVSPGGSPPTYDSRWRLPHFLQMSVQYDCTINLPAALRARETSKSRQRYLLMKGKFL